MKQSILHLIILFALAFIAMFGLLGEPTEDATFLRDIFLSRLMGAAALAALVALWRRWAKTDAVIRAIENYSNETLKA